MTDNIDDYSFDLLFWEPIPFAASGLVAYLQPWTRSGTQVSSLKELQPILATSHDFTLIMELYSFQDTLFEVVQFVLSLRRQHPALKLIIFTGIKNTGILRLLAADPQLVLISKSDRLDCLLTGIGRLQARLGYCSPAIKRCLYSGEEKNSSLSQAEWQVLCLLVAGHSTQKIAEGTSCSCRTISMQKKNIMRKIANRNVEFNRLVIQLRARLTLDGGGTRPPLGQGKRANILTRL